MNIKQKLGKRIRKLREEKGFSQEKLAEVCGLHRTYISTVELGKRNISLVNIEKIANALSCQIKDFF